VEPIRRTRVGGRFEGSELARDTRADGSGALLATIGDADEGFPRVSRRESFYRAVVPSRL